MRSSSILFLAACLAVTTADAQQSAKAQPTRAEILSAARSIISKARYGTFVTLGEKGEPRARIVDPFSPDSSFTVWVATNSATRKVKEIKRDSRVVILWFEPENPGYVTLAGRAQVVSDKAEKEKHWKDDWKVFYKDKNHGEDYVLIRVKPTHMEVISRSAGLDGDPKTWVPASVDFR